MRRNLAVRELLCGQYGAILVDAPLRFKTYNNATSIFARGSKRLHYRTMPTAEIMALPVMELGKLDCVLFSVDVTTIPSNKP